MSKLRMMRVVNCELTFFLSSSVNRDGHLYFKL